MRFETSVVLFALGALTGASILEDGQLAHVADKSIVHPEFMVQEPWLCKYAVNRIRDSTKNVDPNVAIRNSSKDSPYSDPEFYGSSSFYWNEMPIENDRDSLVDDWQKSGTGRITQMFGSNKYSMWGTNGIELVDPNQGSLGDCWFVAAASAVAQTPGRIRSLFMTDELNENGVYTVQLYSMGIPVTVTVDDRLPFVQQSNGTWKLMFAKESEDGALWVPILEKAVAKLYGNYERLIGGQLGPAIQTLTGAPYQDVMHKDKTVDELWNWIEDKIQLGCIMSAGTAPGSQDSDQEVNDIGVAYMHAYTMLGTKKLSNGQRLLRIRNPWGQEKFFGDWSDKSWKWTQELKQEVDYVNDDDGMWYISIEDFHRSFSTTAANYNVDSFHHTHYAAFNVNTPKVSDDPRSDANLVKEVLKISSEVDQMVYLSAYTHNRQHIENSGCWTDQTVQAKQLYFRHSRMSSYQGFKWQNYYHAEGVQMTAGESLDIEIEVYWPPEDFSPHDYSVVAWSEKQKVNLVSTQNHKYEDFPHYTINPDLVIRSPNGAIVNGGGADQPCAGTECVHSGYLGNNGDKFTVDMNVTGSNSMRLYISLLEGGQSFDTRLLLTYNGSKDITMTGYCGDEKFTMTKHAFDEMDRNDWKSCESGKYWLRTLSNIEKKRWVEGDSGWLEHDAWLQLEFEVFGYNGVQASQYKISWDFETKTIYGAWNKDKADTIKWDYSSSEFTTDNTLALKSETASDAETSEKHVSTGVMAGVSVAAASLLGYVFMTRGKNVVSDDFQRV